jgi:hypothetical protein
VATTVAAVTSTLAAVEAETQAAAEISNL